MTRQKSSSKLPPRRQVLAALDASPHGQELARYLGGLLAGSQVRVVLFHVLDQLPAGFYDVDLPALKSKAREIAAWDWEQSTKASEAVAKARGALLAAGLGESQVLEKTKERKKGVARDILGELRGGYAALALGRRGGSQLKDMVLGSTAHKLVHAQKSHPVWVVDGEPDTDSFLVGMDGSPGCLKALKHLAAAIRHKTAARVRLLFVLRRLGMFLEPPVSDAAAEMDQSWEAVVEDSIGPVLEKARRVMLSAGLAPDMVDSKVITGVASRAGAMVEEADSQGFGTIVLGRRGISRVREFVMGRVSNKVLNMAKGKAVWIIS